MTDNGFLTWRNQVSLELEQALSKLCENHLVEPSLREALNYAVFPAGKRIRPMLSLAMAADLGSQIEALLPAVAGLELMHCASLIHDDLPAIDNDEMRRGKPSCHKALGESTALLAGDLAVPLAIHGALSTNLKPEQRTAIANELTVAYVQLCNGQQLDLMTGAARGELTELYAKKTGALFGAACAIAVIAASAAPELVSEARRFGLELGVLFQLQDDAIDHLPEKGRDSSSDSRNNKDTAFLRHGLQALDGARENTIKALAQVECAVLPTALGVELSKTRKLLSPILSGVIE